ncbi:MAG: pyruvate formate lyase-activating protein, partial [Methanobacteriota archaeon]
MDDDRREDQGLGLLAIDVGRGTQDILVYTPERSIENSPKLILPSPTVVVARRIAEATRGRRDIVLTGFTMGGGPNVEAVARHIRAGLAVYATKEAALTIHDNLDRVRERGIAIVDSPPEGAVPIPLTDYMEREIRAALDLFSIPYPRHLAMAVQDHGFSPERSNRIVRFELIRNALESHEWQIAALVRDPPLPAMTRMDAIIRQVPGSLVIDTGPAALMGALCDPVVGKHRREGLTLVNAGNGHTLCFTLKGDRLCGLFEHHTAALEPAFLTELIGRLRAGTLTNQEILDDGGHGAAVDRPLESSFVAITGPNRSQLLPSV